MCVAPIAGGERMDAATELRQCLRDPAIVGGRQRLGECTVDTRT